MYHQRVHAIIVVRTLSHSFIYPAMLRVDTRCSNGLTIGLVR